MHHAPTFEDSIVTITRVGTNQQYATGWESAFAAKKPAKATTKAAATKPAKKASPKKKSAVPKKKAKK